MTSPAFLISNAGTRLVFRQWYNLERGFDGGMLEIKIGSGAFMDILDAGGSFMQGGYIQTLATDSSCANPLAGRSAWTGDSGGYFTTTASLPVTAAGQNVQFRWRAGFDCGVANSGWWIHSVSIVGSVLCASCAVQCNFTLNATSQNFLPAGGIGNIAITVSAASCNGVAVSNDNWINITIGATGTGKGVTAFTLAKADFDGDGKTDLSTWRGSNGTWYTLSSASNSVQSQPLGVGYAPYFDSIVPGDYDGDGKADIAVWRRDGIWYVKRSSNGSFLVRVQGQSGDVPVPAYGCAEMNRQVAIQKCKRPLQLERPSFEQGSMR